MCTELTAPATPGDQGQLHVLSFNHSLKHHDEWANGWTDEWMIAMPYACNSVRQ